MRLRAAGLASIAAGGLLIAYAAMQGDVRVGLFLIVPFVYGTGLAPFAGMLLVMAGFVMLAASSFARMAPGGWEPAEAPPASPGGPAPQETRRARHGGVILLGPIPIVWGSDRKVLPWMIAAGAALLLLALWLTAGRR